MLADKTNKSKSHTQLSLHLFSSGLAPPTLETEAEVEEWHSLSEVQGGARISAKASHWTNGRVCVFVGGVSRLLSN